MSHATRAKKSCITYEGDVTTMSWMRVANMMSSNMMDESRQMHFVKESCHT